MLTKKTNDNVDAENILDSDIENEFYEKQTELADVLKKVGFLNFFCVLIFKYFFYNSSLNLGTGNSRKKCKSCKQKQIFRTV